MAKSVRGKTQAKKDREALQKLKSTGLYKGKIDGRKKPNAYQKGLLNKYADVISGRASVVRPKDPASYKGLFRVQGDAVIVPRRKGEKIKVNKAGNIEGERKVGERTVKSKFKRVKSDADLSAEKRTMFFVPFIRGKDANGKPILEWKRFPSKDALLNVMGGYEHRQKNPYVNWQDYVIEERIDPAKPYTMTGDLNERLNKKLGTRKRRRIRFDDDNDGEE